MGQRHTSQVFLSMTLSNLWYYFFILNEKRSYFARSHTASDWKNLNHSRVSRPLTVFPLTQADNLPVLSWGLENFSWGQPLTTASMGMAVFQRLVSVSEQTTGKPMLVRASSKVLVYQLSGYLPEQ